VMDEVVAQLSAPSSALLRSVSALDIHVGETSTKVRSAAPSGVIAP
jgi:hypothetical protein